MNKILAAALQAGVRAVQGAHQGYKSGEVTPLFPPMAGELMRVAYSGPGDTAIYANTDYSPDSAEGDAQAYALMFGAGLALTQGACLAVGIHPAEFFKALSGNPESARNEAIKQILEHYPDRAIDRDMVLDAINLHGAISTVDPETGRETGSGKADLYSRSGDLRSRHNPGFRPQ